jgi:hypothetical protein
MEKAIGERFAGISQPKNNRKTAEDDDDDEKDWKMWCPPCETLSNRLTSSAEGSVPLPLPICAT